MNNLIPADISVAQLCNIKAGIQALEEVLIRFKKINPDTDPSIWVWLNFNNIFGRNASKVETEIHFRNLGGREGVSNSIEEAMHKMCYEPESSILLKQAKEHRERAKTLTKRAKELEGFNK